MVTITKVMEQVYILKDRAECFSNLILGKERALVFDTGCGVDDMLEAVRSITDLPLLVIVSHGHYDHIGGSYQFDRVFFPKEDRPILEHYDDNILNGWIRETASDENTPFIYFGYPEWPRLHDLNFDSFDLGGLECQIVTLPGHTKGSVGIFIPDLKLLLSGDALTPIMCLIFINHMSKEIQYDTLKKVQQLDFDYYLTSHHDKMLPKSLISRMMECIKRSYGRKHYDYQYPRPPYSKGWFYLDSIEEEPVGIVDATMEKGLVTKDR